MWNIQYPTLNHQYSLDSLGIGSSRVPDRELEAPATLADGACKVAGDTNLKTSEPSSKQETGLEFDVPNLHQVIPNAVQTPEETGYTDTWAVAHAKIMPVLVKAIQDQQAQIEALKQEIQAMKTGYAPSNPVDSGNLATGDFDGDGRDDWACVDSDGNWNFYIAGSGFAKVGPYNFGVAGQPMVGDFDGDGKADPGMMSDDGNWYAWLSSIGYTKVNM